MEPYYGIKCPNCGHETNVDPALLDDDAPMVYCPECDEPLFGEPDEE
jgi:predicted nucleic acid-binding Zn ribbon protein